MSVSFGLFLVRAFLQVFENLKARQKIEESLFWKQLIKNSLASSFIGSTSLYPCKPSVQLLSEFFCSKRYEDILGSFEFTIFLLTQIYSSKVIWHRSTRHVLETHHPGLPAMWMVRKQTEFASNYRWHEASLIVLHRSKNQLIYVLMQMNVDA